MDRDRMALMCWSLVHGTANLLTEGVMVSKRGRIPVPPEQLAERVITGLGTLLGRP